MLTKNTISSFSQLLARELREKRCELNEPYRKRVEEGMKLEAEYEEDGQFYSATVDSILDNGNFMVTFDEYGNREEVTLGHLKLKNISSKSKKSSRSSRRSGSRGRKRSRSRSRSRRRGRSRSLSPESQMKLLEEKVRRQERDAAVANGKDYARRPTGLKEALSMKLQVGTNRKRSASPIRRRKISSSRRADRSRSRSRSRSPVRRKVDSAKLNALKARYGDASSSKKKPSSSNGRPRKTASAVKPITNDEEVIRLG